MSAQKLNEINECGICSKESSEIVQAKFWCADCCLHICQSCFDEHRNNRIKQYHLCTSLENLKDPSHKSQTNEKGWVLLSSIFVEPKHCKDFEDGCIARSSFCYDHQVILCSICVLRRHKECKKIRDLKHVAASMKKAKMTIVLNEKLNKFIKQTIIILDELAHQHNSMDNRQAEIVIAGSDISEEIAMHIAELERPIHKTIEKLHKNAASRITEEIDICRKLKKDTEYDLKHLKDAKNNGSRLIEVVLRLRVQLDIYDDKMKNVYFCVDNVDYKFVKDHQAVETISSMKGLGRIESQVGSLHLPPFLSLKKITHFKDRNIQIINRLNCHVDEDTEDCYIISCLFLADNRFVIADKTNTCLKLFTIDGELKSYLSLEGEPWGTAVLNEEYIAVTIPTKKAIQVIEIPENNALIPAAETILDYECWGISAANEKVFITGDPMSPCPSLRILTFSGDEISSVSEIKDKPIFGTPLHVTVPPFPASIIVSDSGKDCVIALTEDMNVNFRYKNKKLRYPSGIDTDREGNIYVCGFESSNIQLLSLTGKFIKELASSLDNLEAPRLISLLPNGDKLLVNHGKKCVTVMQLC